MEICSGPGALVFRPTIYSSSFIYTFLQPTKTDVEGRVSNFIDVSEFAPYTGDINFFDKSKEQKIPDSDFNTNIPDLDEVSFPSLFAAFL